MDLTFRLAYAFRQPSKFEVMRKIPVLWQDLAPLVALIFFKKFVSRAVPPAGFRCGLAGAPVVFVDYERLRLQVAEMVRGLLNKSPRFVLPRHPTAQPQQ